jgi:hypothetical protein
VLADCVGSYFPEFQRAGLAMIAAQGGIFGWVAPSSAYLDALNRAVPSAVNVPNAVNVPSAVSPAAVGAATGPERS